MSETLEQVRALVARGDVRVSLHGYEELAADNIRVHDIIDGLLTAVLVEDYPKVREGALRPGSTARSRRPADSCSLGYPRKATVTGGPGDRVSA